MTCDTVLMLMLSLCRYPSLEAPLENFRCRAPSSKCMKRLVTQMEALEMLR